MAAQTESAELLNQIDVGKSESVSIYFGDADQPKISRAAYDRSIFDYAAKARVSMLKKPDYKKMYADGAGPQIDYDDPKYLPWQIHLREIASSYESRSLPEKMELIPKQTDESYRLKMFPKNLPGHEGYSAVSIEGDLKSQFISQPLGPGRMRWPENTVSVEMNHDLIYRDDTTQVERNTFLLEQMGYQLKKSGPSTATGI